MDIYASPTIDEAKEQEIDVPHFVQFPSIEPPHVLMKYITENSLIKHGGGGYFKETDRSPYEMDVENITKDSTNSISEEETKRTMRHYSSLIYSLLTPDSPVAKFLKLKQRTIHILQKGRGQCVLIYPDGTVKSFKVGFEYETGEVSQWVVPGNVFKACFLLPNEEFENGLLISEVVVPGFDFEDVDFISGKDELKSLVGQEKSEQLKFLI